jgi:two-component system heavy metal sensor histidine kinase CusS
VRLSGRASLSVRLTALFAAASCVVLLGLGYLVGAAVEQHFVEQDIALLRSKLDLTRQALARVHNAQDLLALPQQLDDSLVGEHGLAVVVMAPDGQILFASRGTDFPQTLLAQPMRAEMSPPMTWRSGEPAGHGAAETRPFRGVAMLLPTGIAGAPPARVGVATDITHHEQFMGAFRTTLWTFVVLAALLSGVLGGLAARRGLAPLQDMKRKAESITAQRLDARLAVDDVPVELAELARTLNGMLARLEESFRRLSDFSSDLAHEFRTPVSNLLTQTQVTLARPRSAAEYAEVLVSNSEEFERLSRMIAGMLFLAKADQGQLVPSRERLDLAPLLADLVDFHRLLADDKGISIRCQGEGTIDGDSLMLRRSISNLLDNAIRHTPAGGQITLSLRAPADNMLRIDVENSGESIAAEQLPRLFDRFYRADPARSGEGMHSGLGLAIVKSIAQAHGGTVQVTSGNGLTCFSLLLPQARPVTSRSDG